MRSPARSACLNDSIAIASMRRERSFSASGTIGFDGTVWVTYMVGT
jgi:hypothetical protein